eukprot:ctg_883.g413
MRHHRAVPERATHLFIAALSATLDDNRRPASVAGGACSSMRCCGRPSEIACCRVRESRARRRATRRRGAPRTRERCIKSPRRKMGAADRHTHLIDPITTVSSPSTATPAPGHEAGGARVTALRFPDSDRNTGEPALLAVALDNGGLKVYDV